VLKDFPSIKEADLKIYLLSLTVTILIVAAFFAGRFSSSLVRNTVENVSDTRQTDSTATAMRSAIAVHTIPAYTGHTYHALDLLIKRPFPDQGGLISLDVAAQPSVGYGMILAYNTWPGRIPEEANARGVRFSQMLGDTICIFDVIQAVTEDGKVVPQSAGQIAVEIIGGSHIPDSDGIWDVEPEGIEEVTTNNGTVLHLPKVRFWRYHNIR